VSLEEPPGPPFHVRRVAVIGAGRVGRTFALACVAAGFEVVLEDVMPANLRRAQEEYADLSATGRLEVASTVEDAVREADIAVDFVPDELESKLEIFSMIDRMAPPKTILLTPSEALSITDLASCTYRGDRCFTVRGGLLSDELPIRLLWPECAASDLLAATFAFLERLGRQVISEPDPDPPMLVKNSRS